ncbi:hypothetical protein H671_5g14481 [Cricetulus griseus]|nr:hypothetical protein H671_5g14481 [Cricetulus griseus]
MSAPSCNGEYALKLYCRRIRVSCVVLAGETIARDNRGSQRRLHVAAKGARDLDITGKYDGISTVKRPYTKPHCVPHLPNQASKPNYSLSLGKGDTDVPLKVELAWSLILDILTNEIPFLYQCIQDSSSFLFYQIQCSWIYVEIFGVVLCAGWKKACEHSWRKSVLSFPYCPEDEAQGMIFVIVIVTTDIVIVVDAVAVVIAIVVVVLIIIVVIIVIVIVVVAVAIVIVVVPPGPQTVEQCDPHSE